MLENIGGIMRDLEKENKAYNNKWEQVRLSAIAAKAHNIARICARHELESDEFYTAEEKAVLFYK